MELKLGYIYVVTVDPNTRYLKHVGMDMFIVYASQSKVYSYIFTIMKPF